MSPPNFCSFAELVSTHLANSAASLISNGSAACTDTTANRPSAADSGPTQRRKADVWFMGEMIVKAIRDGAYLKRAHPSHRPGRFSDQDSISNAISFIFEAPASAQS